MRDYVYHRIFQNASTEAVTDNDVVIALNTALFMLSANITHPLLSLEKRVTTTSPSKIFSFEADIKKINKIQGLKEGSEEWVQLTQTYNEPRTFDECGMYEFQAYGSTVRTEEEFVSVKYNGESMLPYIQNTSESLSRNFPLGEFLAGAICEYCMSLLVPANITEGYNLAQYHESVFNKMINTASKVYSNVSGQKTLKNNIQ